MCVDFLLIFVSFVSFRVSQQGVCVLRCLRRFADLRKTRPGILEHVPCVFYRLLFFFVNFGYLFAGFRVSKQGVCVLRCLRRPEPPEKPRP